jgi:hypothetical protein
LKTLKLLSGAVFLCLVVAGPTNLVVNPGFETGSLSPWVTINGDQWDVDTDLPHTGTHYADTGCVGTECLIPAPNANSGALYQDIPTTPGAVYSLTFFYFPGPSGEEGDDTAELQVLWGPTATQLVNGGAATCTGNCVFDNNSIGSTTYVQYTVNNLIATSNSMRLEFLGRQDPDSDGLDDVSLVQTSGPTPGTPAPSSSILVLIGLIGAGLYWRFMRSRRNAS